MPPVLHGLSLDPNQRLSNALLTRDEARRIAANVACQSRGVRHDTATRQRIWPSCRSNHCLRYSAATAASGCSQERYMPSHQHIDAVEPNRTCASSHETLAQEHRSA